MSPRDGQSEREKEIQRAAISDQLEKIGIYRRYQWVTFDSIEARGLPQSTTLRHNYEEVKNYAANLAENVANGRGLILAGSYGTMKTTMAIAVLREWWRMGESGLIIPMVSLVDNLFTMRALNKEEWARYERKIRRVKLLILDDLGGENTDQGWVLAKIDSIITERYNRMLPVIVTTNMNQQDLNGTYSDRILDRLRSTSKWLTFNGKSQRGVMR